jgi:hypothetical protein
VTDLLRSSRALDLSENLPDLFGSSAGQRASSDIADPAERPKSLDHDLGAAGDLAATTQGDTTDVKAERTLRLRPRGGLDEIATRRCLNELVPLLVYC